MRVIQHGFLVLLGLFALLGLPFLRTETGRLFLSGEKPDAVSSASVVLDQPSGQYVVLLNEALHTDADNLETWKNFFHGGEIGILFEDISCSVPNGDAGAWELAKSFQSQLPENQMKVAAEDAVMLFSRADAGQFDILIFSREFAEIYGADSARSDTADWIEVEGGV